MGQISEIQQKKYSFLLAFTKELIQNSNPEYVSKLKLMIGSEQPMLLPHSENKEAIKKAVKQKISEERNLPKRMNLAQEIHRPLIPPRPIRFNAAPDVLRIPEPRLPEEFQYLHPVIGNKQIDLDRLNTLVRDPAVKTIECGGPNKRLVVSGNMGMKPTTIILNEDEIDSIIDKFSKASKIPSHAGVFKVVVGDLVLSAVISDVIGTRFIIRKMVNPSAPMPGRR